MNVEARGRQGKRLAEGPSQPATKDICEADRAVPVDRGEHWAEDHVFKQVPLCISKGPTDLAQWTLITSDGGCQRLGACQQGEPMADSLLSPGASPPAHNPAVQQGEREGDGNDKEFPCAWPTSDLIPFSVGSEDHQMGSLADVTGSDRPCAGEWRYHENFPPGPAPCSAGDMAGCTSGPNTSPRGSECPTTLSDWGC